VGKHRFVVGLFGLGIFLAALGPIHVSANGTLPPPIPRSLPPVTGVLQSQARVVKLPTLSSAQRSGNQAISRTANPLLYQGGMVLTSVHVYVDYWGPEWQAPAQAAVESYIDGFYTDLGGSRWAAIMGEYCSGIAVNSSSCPKGSNFINNPAPQLQASIIDTNPVPTTPTQADIQNEAAKAAGLYGYPSDSVFIVYTPTGKSQIGFGTAWCAYHSSVAVGSTNVAYAYVPYLPDIGATCGGNTVSGPLDGFSIVGGHEYAEAVTDPFPGGNPGGSGWLDPTIASSEIGDKCIWGTAAEGIPSAANVTMNGHAWPVQPLFSNRALAQQQTPCVFLTPRLGAAQSGLAPLPSRSGAQQSGSGVSGQRTVANPIVALPDVSSSPATTRQRLVIRWIGGLRI
jgi:serine protease